MKSTIFCILLFTVILQSAQADEGFYSIRSDLPMELSQSFLNFPEGFDCGSVRINQTRPYYLTALHCIVLKQFEPNSVRTIGSPMNSESLNYYGDLKGKTASKGSYSIRILANGRCFTGYALDVLAQASKEEVNAAKECLKGDWVIFERLDSGPTAGKCAKANSGNFPSGTKIKILGGSRSSVQRKVGLAKLDGNVYSKGSTFELSDLLRNSNFPSSLVPLWESISHHNDITNGFLITDADVINGMSGGPIFNGTNLVGVTTVAFLPTYIYDFPGLTGMAEGYNYGIHGGIPIKMIITASNEHFFSCN